MRTVHYETTRAELWRWYWRAWARPAGLWRYHALIALIVAASSERGGDWSLSRFLATFAVTALACIVVFPLYPQLRYKPQRRDLSIDEKGYATQIGKRSGSRRWDEVASIHEDADAIVLTTTSGNAMIVPRRAFSTEDERRTFLDDARRWHAAARGLTRA